VDHSPTGLRGCVVILKPLDVRIADGVRRCPRRQGESVFSRNSTELLPKTPAPAEGSSNDIGCTGSAKRCASVERLESQRTCLWDGEIEPFGYSLLTIWWLLEDAHCSIPMRSATRVLKNFLRVR
jgi:hypothetical protein